LLTVSQVNCIFYFTLFWIAKREQNKEFYPTFYITSLPTARSITNLRVNEVSHIFSQMMTNDEENAGTLVVLGHELPPSPSSGGMSRAIPLFCCSLTRWRVKEKNKWWPT
jgi:hypothetical protein